MLAASEGASPERLSLSFGPPRGGGLRPAKSQMLKIGYTPRLTVGETAALGCEWRPSEEGRCHVPAPARDPESGAATILLFRLLPAREVVLVEVLQRTRLHA